VTAEELGVGIVWLPGLEPLIESIPQAWDFIEVEPQAFWIRTGTDDRRPALRLDRTAFERMRATGRPVLVHSVGSPVGAAEAADPAVLRALGESLSCLGPPWWSEHASVLTTGRARRSLGFLMPPVQSAAAVVRIADNVRRLQETFGLPFAFETGVNYLRPQRGEIPDGEFWGAIAERAGCGILLDLHNVWTNERNGRYPAAAVLDALPLDRVWEIHLAGGHEYRGYWLDAHSSLPPPALMDVARQLVPRLHALRGIVFEIMPDYLAAAGIGATDLANCLAELRSVWSMRGTEVRRSSVADRELATRSGAGCELPDLETWEARLRGTLDRSVNEDGLRLEDPGVPIYRDLIDASRRGTIAEALPLSTQYLLLALGEDAFEELLEAFWRVHSPEPFMSDEAASFATFVGSRQVLPHLNELLSLEIAAHRAAMSGETQSVRFTCDAEAFVGDLKRGTLPRPLPPCELELAVTPPQLPPEASACSPARVRSNTGSSNDSE
jgi:uncharacterized protein